MQKFKRFFLLICFLLSLLWESKPSFICINHQQYPIRSISIGLVIDQKSRLGKEQRTAVEVAVDDLRRHCLNVSLHIRDFNGSQTCATYEAIALVNGIQVDAILGPTTLQEAALLSEFNGNIRVISLSQTAPIPRKSSPKLPSFVQFSTSINYQTRCIASIISHFKWTKAILMQEQSSTYSENQSPVINHLSDSLKDVHASVESHFTFPKLSSLSDPKAFIDEALKIVRSQDVRVFVLMHVSLEFAVMLFERAKGLGMIEKGYAWIVSDEVANFLNSVDPSVIDNMQGMIGFKTYYDEMSDHFKEFKSKFRRKYTSQYPSEEENSNPSLYSLLAYDAIWTIANDSLLFENEYPSDVFQGLGGKIRFKNGLIAQQPVFSIINVFGKSYKEITYWSELYGFFNNVKDHVLNNESTMNLNSDSNKLSTISWPGGDQNVPRGFSLGSKENPLVIGVSANGTFPQFVQVINNTGTNQTSFKGFSIEVFKSAFDQLTYPPEYIFVPHYGTYDEMVDKVSNQTYHAAVGDTGITAKRYEHVDFSQPYIGSDLVMIVPVKLALKESKFLPLRVFTTKMWIKFAALGILTGAIIWLSEYATGNEEFPKSSFLKLVGSVLWFSVTIISLSQKQQIITTPSRLVLTVWLCTVFVVAASFTAVLSSMLIVPRLRPSIVDLDSLRNTNAIIACNANSFVYKYLIDVLGFNQDRIHRIATLNDYHEQFHNGNIKAAFLQSPHARVFLADHCNDYIISGPSFKLGGLGFAFQKGAAMTSDISEAILNLTQSGRLDTLVKNLLTSSSSSCSSSGNGESDIILGDQPFSGIFQVLGGLIGLAFFIAIVRLMKRDTSITTSVHDLLQKMLIKYKICMWAYLVLTECCTRFGVPFFRQGIVRTGVGRDHVEPNLVAIELVIDRG